MRDYEISRIETVLGAGLVPHVNNVPEAALSTYAVVAKSGPTLYLNLAPSGTDRVGIGSFGSGAPAGLLHVRQGASGATPDGDADDLVVESDGDTGISILSPDADNAQIYFGSTTDSVGAFLRWDRGANTLTLATASPGGKMIFRTDSQDTAMAVHDDKRVSIGTPTAGGQLKVEQPIPGAVRPVLVLLQRADDEGFILYRGTASSAQLTNSLVAEADVDTATRKGFVKVARMNLHTH